MTGAPEDYPIYVLVRGPGERPWTAEIPFYWEVRDGVTLSRLEPGQYWLSAPSFSGFDPVPRTQTLSLAVGESRTVEIAYVEQP